MKKIFLIPLMACFSCVMAWGATNVAKIGDTNYTSFNTALTAATEGQTIVLLTNITKASNATNELRTVSANITIDGQGQYSVSRAFQVSANKTLTLKDVTVNNGVKCNPAGAIVLKNGATVVLDNAEIAPAVAAVLPVRTVDGASGTIQLVSGTTNIIRNNAGTALYTYKNGVLTISGEGNLTVYHTGTTGYALSANAAYGSFLVSAPNVTFIPSDPTKFIGANAKLADGYLALYENGVYKVLPTSDSRIAAVADGIAYSSIAAAVEAVSSYSEIMLWADAPATTIARSIIIKSNGHDASAISAGAGYTRVAIEGGYIFGKAASKSGNVYTVNNFEELWFTNHTAVDGDVIKLAADIDGGTNPTVTIESGKTVNLDLNGHRFYASVTTNGGLITNKGNLTVFDSQNGHSGIIENTYIQTTGYVRFIENAGTLWVKKGQLIAQSEMCINVQTGATLIVGTEGGSNDDVLIESKSNGGITNASGYPGSGENDAVAMTLRANSNTTIYCGTIKSATHPSIYAVTAANLNIHDGRFLMNPDIAPAWLDGGSIDFITISGGSYSTTPEKYLDQTHRAILNTNNNLFEVIEILVPRDVTVYNTTDIVEAINGVTLSQAVNMTLGANITLDQNIELPHGSALIIPAGKTLTVPDNIVFVNEGTTTNNGEIIILGTGFFSKPTKVEGNGAFTMSGYSKNEVAGVVNYAISTPMQLQYIGYLALQDEYADKTWNIVLNTDLSMPTNANFESILEVQGTFDGQKHAINNLTGSGLFTYFKGNIKNLTMNNLNLQGGAVLCDILKENSIIENVTLNGSNTATTSNACGFVGNAEVIETAENSYGMRQASDYIWFVNCVNNVTLYTQKGWFPASFIGTITGAKGTVGIYNCKNTANITGDFLYAGAAIGYGSSASTARIEFINFENTGTITAPTEPLDFCEVANLIGYNMEASKVICDKIDPATWTAVYDEAQGKYVAKQQGILDNKGNTPTTDWAQNTTWTSTDDETYVVPNAADNVTVNNNEGVVVTTTDAVAKQVTVNTSLTVKDGATLTVGEGGLTIASTATVTVEQGATLVIGEAGLTNNGKLEVKGTLTKGTGVVLFDPAADAANTRVQAEVSITPDAHKKGENSLLYRYIGIPLYFEGSVVFVKATNWAVSDPTATIYFKEWNPLTGWDNLNAWADLVPFKGYATSNSTVNNLTYTFKGNLVGNANQTLNFAYGFNMYANSYTAPIQIQTLLNSFDENVNATIYMFDDGVVKSVSKSAFNGYEDPEFTSIPSLQAFFVLMENEGMTPTENINYANTVYNFHGMNDAFYAPARHETPDFNRVRINVANENGANDAVYMIEAADFTNEFDNGYDAVKYMNTGLNLFATTAHGRQSSNYSNSIEGSFIGVQGNGTYTMSFDKLAGEEYQIRDLENDAVITMSENNTYTFTVNGTNEARFVVETIAKMPTAIDNVNAANMFVSNNTLFVGANNADIQIYGANGQLVLSEKAQPTVDLSGLATGVYTVRVANQSLKFVK